MTAPLRPQSAEQQSLSQILEPKGSISNIPAIQSAIKFIEEDLAPRKCDSYGVSNCVRCTSVFLARTMAKILKAYARAAAPKTQSPDAERTIRAVRAVLAEVHFQSDQKEIAQIDNAKFLDRRAGELAPLLEKEYGR